MKALERQNAQLAWSLTAPSVWQVPATPPGGGGFEVGTLLSSVILTKVGIQDTSRRPCGSGS
jgi:hypothetical protein